MKQSLTKLKQDIKKLHKQKKHWEANEVYSLYIREGGKVLYSDIVGEKGFDRSSLVQKKLRKFEQKAKAEVGDMISFKCLVDGKLEYGVVEKRVKYPGKPWVYVVHHPLNKDSSKLPVLQDEIIEVLK